MLTKYQQVKFDNFLEAAINRKSLLYVTRLRRTGKTYLLNELSFTLQALGYIVYVLPCNIRQEHVGDRMLISPMELLGINYERVVVIVDFVDIKEIIKYENCTKPRGIPIIGFITWERNVFKRKKEIPLFV